MSPHLNASCRPTFEYLLHVAIWIHHVARSSQSRHTLERAASHTGISHVTRHVTWAVLRVSWVKKTRRFVTSPIVVVGQAIIKVKWRHGLARCQIRGPCSRIKVRAPVVLNDREREPHKRFKTKKEWGQGLAATYAHLNESCHTFEWVMPQIWMSHVTHLNESCHTLARRHIRSPQVKVQTLASQSANARGSEF